MVISNNFIDKNWIYVVFAGYNIEGGGGEIGFQAPIVPHHQGCLATICVVELEFSIQYMHIVYNIW